MSVENLLEVVKYDDIQVKNHYVHLCKITSVIIFDEKLCS